MRFEIVNREMKMLKPFPKSMSLRSRIMAAVGKWETIAAYHRAAGEMELQRIGSSTCALCVKFYEAHDCQGCPVYIRSKRRCCDNTPIRVYYNKRTYSNAMKAVKFLRSLL